VLFGHFPRLSNILEKLPKGYPRDFAHFPAAFLYPLSSGQQLSKAEIS
jgi:hypothetical protein